MNLRAIEGDEAVAAAVPLAATETDVSYQPMALAGMARFVADYEIDAA
jgi:hypothetical protein